MASGCAGRDSGWILGKISSLEEGISIELDFKESGGVTNPGSVQKTSGCGVLQYGLVNMLVSKQRFNLMILDSFYKHNDAVITSPLATACRNSFKPPKQFPEHPCPLVSKKK